MENDGKSKNKRATKSTTRRALGRGLASLIPDYDEPRESKVSTTKDQVTVSNNNPFTYVPIDRLVPFARQPRQKFNEEEITWSF